MRGFGAEQEVQVLHVVGKVLIGIFIAFGVCAVCLLVFSMGVTNGLLPEKWIQSLTTGACLFGSGVGGWFVCKHQNGYRLLAGAAVGSGLFLMLLTIGCFVYHSVNIERGGVFLLVGCLCGGSLSGVLSRAGKGKGGSKTKRRKRR